MVLLDSDHLSLLQRGGAEGHRIKQRLGHLPATEVATTIVNYEEQMRGWLARLARATTLERQVSDYRELKSLLRRYCSVPVEKRGQPIYSFVFHSYPKASLARTQGRRLFHCLV